MSINWVITSEGAVGTINSGRYEISPYEHGYFVHFYVNGDPTPVAADGFTDFATAKQACEDDYEDNYG